MKVNIGLLTIIILLLALAPQISCRRKPSPVVAVIPKGQTAVFWQQLHAGAIAAGREYGIDIRWNAPGSEIDFERQANIVEDFIGQRVDGIVLAPAHGEALVPIVERTAQERIPMVIVDSGIQTTKYLTYVATDNYRAGILAAERMGAILAPRGTIAMIGASPGNVSSTERETTFRETIAGKYPKLQVVDFQYGMSDHVKAVAAAEEILTAHPGLNGIFCSNESATLGAVEAAKTRGLAGKIKVVGFDAAPDCVRDLKAGAIDALIVQNPFKMGFAGVEAIAQHLRGKSVEKRIVTGATVVTADNLKDPAIKLLIDPEAGGSRK